MKNELTNTGSGDISSEIKRNANATEAIAEILENLVLHAADGDTYTGNQALAKILSNALQYVHKTNGQYHINIGDIWGVFGNYRYGMEGGEGTWNGIWQKVGANHNEVLHTDPNIVRLKRTDSEVIEITESGVLVKKTSSVAGGQTAFSSLSNFEVHIGTGESPDSQKNGLEISQYYNLDSNNLKMSLKFLGQYVMQWLKTGSMNLGVVYNGQRLNLLRGGRDVEDKAFYTELLMNDRAFFQIGSGDLSGSATPPSYKSDINNNNSYMRIFYPNGKELLYYGPRTTREVLEFYSIIGHKWLSVGRASGYGYNQTEIQLGEDASFLELLSRIIRIGGAATELINIGNGNANSKILMFDEVSMSKQLTVTENVKANNIPELELESGAAGTVTLKDYATDSNLGGDSQYSAYVQNDTAEHAWKFGTNNGEGKGYHQNVQIPVTLADYLDYEVHALVKSNTGKQLGIALCSNVYAPDYAKFVNTTTSYQDLNFGKVQDFQNRQNTLSLAMNTGSSADYFFIKEITLQKPGTPEGNYVLTAQVTMVGGQPHVEYKWVKQ